MPFRTPQVLTPRTMRLFSSSKSFAAPRQDPPPPSESSFQQSQNKPSSPSSSSSILSMSRRSNNYRNNNNNNNHNGSSSSPNRAPQRGDAASRLLEQYRSRAEVSQKSRQAQVDYLREVQESNAYMRQHTRRFRKGEVYSPSDISGVAMKKAAWMKRNDRIVGDVVNALGMKPLDMYKNFSVIQYFSTSGGGVKHSRATGLSNVNQRKVAKMIRRVQGMGLYPSIHAHPELIRNQFFPTRTGM